MSTFKELYLELTGTFPDLPIAQAKRFINRAQRDAFDAWSWSFLAGEGTLSIPDIVNTGTITLTQNSQVVVADGAAAAIWNTLGFPAPITSRALKLGTDQPYQILAYDGVNTAYIDRPWPNASVSGQTYSMYRCYYTPPETDFERWVSVVDTTNAWNLIIGKKKEWLDWIDPQRQTVGGPAQFIAFFRLQRAQTIPPFGTFVDPITTTTQMLFELWPAPTHAAALTVYYKRRGADLTGDTDISLFEDSVLIPCALSHCYRFVQANQVVFAKTTGLKVNWAEMKKDVREQYSRELSSAIKRDDNITLASLPFSSRGWFPSSSWLQRHATWGEYSQAYAGYYSGMY
jgi:hypothetical protein